MNKYFILAPREISPARIRDLLKKYLPRGQVIFGIAKEPYIAGFENQPQFKTLKPDYPKELAAKSRGRLIVVEYAQADTPKIIEKTNFNRALVINGSFHRSFHLRPEYAAILAKGAELRYLSPFVNETEAKAYAKRFSAPKTIASFDPQNIRQILHAEVARSFDNCFQTATAIVKNDQIITLTHNQVVPYPTYAWHHGASREKHHTPAGNSSQSDAVHAETAALIDAGPEASGATAYMLTFPCPHCAKNLIYAGIKELFYELDYGDPDGYNLLDQAGIKYRRFYE